MIHYVDSGLAHNLGHHAQSCRAIVAGMRSAGQEVAVYGHSQTHLDLSAELGIRPTFRISPYDHPHPCQVAGWLHDFLSIGGQTMADLSSVAPDGSAVYWNSARPAQLFAVVSYLMRHPNSRAVVEFGVGTGLNVAVDGGQLKASFPPPAENADATLYRYCSFLLTDDIRPRLTLATFSARSSELFSQLLDCPVQTFPVPRDGPEVARIRGLSGPLTIAVLGHQRGEKGYHLVPDIVRRVLEYAKWQTRPVRFLIHNGAAAGMPEEQKAVRQLQAEYPDLIDVDERMADGVVWQELLDRSSLIVCPYNPASFYERYSAVVCEAVANGIPLIVPKDTTLAEMALGLGGGFVYPTWDAPTISASIISGIETFEVLAACAADGVGKWKAAHGGGRTAAAIVESLA